MRIGVLYAIGAILGQILVSQKRKPPLVDELIRIRRALVIDGTPVAEAKRSLDLALYGMRFQHLVQNSVAEFLNLTDDVLDRLGKVDVQLEKAIQIMKKEAIEAKDLDVFHALVESFEAAQKEVKEKDNAIKKPLKSIGIRMVLAGNGDDAERFTSLITQRNSDMHIAIDALTSKYDSLLNEIRQKRVAIQALEATDGSVSKFLHFMESSVD